jgi:hypothetical protein
MKLFFLFILLFTSALSLKSQEHQHHRPPAKKEKASAPAKKRVPQQKNESIPAKKGAAADHQHHQAKKDSAGTPANRTTAAGKNDSIPAKKDAAADHQHHQAKKDSAGTPTNKTTAAGKNDSIPAKKDAAADHQHHHQAKKDSVGTPANKTTAAGKNDSIPALNEAAAHRHDQHDAAQPHAMNHAFSRNLPMTRNGSGTSWMPDSSPMYMYMKTSGNTNWMFHGALFMRYNKQDLFNKGSRGGGQFDAPNWFMGMMNKKVGRRGLINVNAMLTLDPLTVGESGYPLLFQSGETYNGKRLVDRQHPHDLFAELSIGYTYQLNKDLDVFGYFGYPGEPALNAPAFMHRISAMNNPDAPLGHHWQDATHITFGVATAGLRYKNVKAEFSSFTGREPDEERYGFDKMKFDSYSFRLSFNPHKNLALQASQGYINSPEAIAPEEDVARTTFSALYSKPLAKPNSFLASAFIWGHNRVDAHHKEHSFLLENNLQLNRNAIYHRYELVEKSAEELDLDHDVFNARNYDVHAFTLGYNRTLHSFRWIDIVAGSQGTVYFPAKQLKPLYGSAPLALQFYIQLRPRLHKHH